MADRIQMSTDEFDLLVRALHREWLQDPKCITARDSSVFYKHPLVHIYYTSINNKLWITLSGQEYVVTMPDGLFNGKEKKKYDAAIEMLDKIKSVPPSGLSAEEVICNNIPGAKDIIAERALVNDHKEPKDA